MKLFNKFWYTNSILSKFVSSVFFPLSLIWITIDRIKFNFVRPYSPKIKVICVGNINVGGTGKTPISIFLFKILEEMGYKPIFLCSAYRSKIKKPVLLKNDLSTCTDEALILRKTGDTVVTNNRLQGVKFIEDMSYQKNYDVIIMDDGLQNYTIKKYISFLIVNKEMMFGNGLCMPAGPLRQKPNSCINVVDRIILIGNENKKISISKFNKKIYNCVIKLNLKGVSYNDKKYFAFSGLAYNLKFFNSLIKENINVKITKEFSDHYRYKEKDIIKLIKIADQNNLNLVTTEKDFVKIPKEFHKKIGFVPIKVEFKKNDLLDLKSYLKKKLNA